MAKLPPMAVVEAGSHAPPAPTALSVEEFDLLARANTPRLRRLLFTILGDADSAATLTQECLLKAFAARESFRGDAKPETWLTRIAINLATEHGRSLRYRFWKRLRRASAEEVDSAYRSEPDTRATAERGLLAKEAVARIWQRVGALPPQQRLVFTMRFVEEMPLGEIAAATGLAPGTVKAHLFRALKAVRAAEDAGR